jgi:hypothetical protein
VPKSSGETRAKYIKFRRLRRYIAENFGMSRQLCKGAGTKISAGSSRVTGPAELIEIVPSAN